MNVACARMFDDFVGSVKRATKNISICPMCGEGAEKNVIDALGECLNCDHLRTDSYREEAKNE